MNNYFPLQPDVVPAASPDICTWYGDAHYGIVTIHRYSIFNSLKELRNFE